MNLTKLFETQRILDARIMEKHTELVGQNNLDWKILALQVELGECANEWRGFKKWSNDQEPRVSVICNWCKGNGFIDNFEPFGEGHSTNECDECDGTGKENRNPLLEEYVDCLHFILSIGLELNINVKGMEKFSVFDTYPNRTEIFIFSKLFKDISNMLGQENDDVLADYYRSFQWLLELGCKLGFTWEQIEQAYYDKNEINHERQNTGY